MACLDAFLQPGKLASEQAHGLLIAASCVLVLGLTEAQHSGGPISMHPHIHEAGVQLGLVHVQHGLGAVAHATHVLDDPPHVGHPLDYLGVGSPQSHFRMCLQNGVSLLGPGQPGVILGFSLN